MIHAYHVILAHYGFWLPNDPRGSWSLFVARWELARFGKATRNLDQRNLSQLTPHELAQREAMRQSLAYPPVCLTGPQALSVANGFRSQVITSGYLVWACSILPEHTHLVIARHRYPVEQIANLLKGSATRQLIDDERHPLGQFAKPNQRPPSMWARHQWKVFLDSDQAIEDAIGYVEQNPVKEGKPRQSWSWVAPYRGIDDGCVSYYDDES